MTAPRHLIAGAILGSLAGCGTFAVSFSQTHPAPRPLAARPPEEVDVLTIPPGRSYVEIGTVNTEKRIGLAHNTSDAEAVAAMRHEAAIRGCDGLVVNQLRLHLENAAPCLVYTDR